MRAMSDHRITNLSAAATHYRMLKNSGRAPDFRFAIQKLSYTGEPIDPATLEFIDRTFGVPACSMYGTTEIGVVLVNYPGAPDFVVNAGGVLYAWGTESLGWSLDIVEERLAGIGHTLLEIYARAETDGVGMNAAAEELARERAA